MPFVILPTNSASGGEYITNSLRYNSGSSDYLSRTPASAGNRQIFTVSLWTKINGNTSRQVLFWSPTSSSTFALFDSGELRFGAGDGANWYYVTTQLFRDPSAWYHIVFAVDTTQATASNRVKLYVNGSQITSFSTTTNPTQNYSSAWNNNAIHYIGAGNDGGITYYYGGYMSEFYNIDGQQLTPSSFGETDFDTGIWKPKAYTGTYGTNGFYLQFKNSASLGTDSSGNGNTFTVNNLTSIDQTTDTPTNNFATWNPLGSGSNVPFTEGNLKPSDDGTAHTSMKGIFISTIGVSKGKWYAEFKYDDSDCIVGIATTTKDYKGLAEYYLGQGTLEYGLDSNGTPAIYTNGSGTTYGSGSTASGDIVSVALDLDNNKLYFAKNGTYYNSGNPATNTNGHSITAGEYYFAGGHGNLSQLFANFGNPPYSANSYTDGAGYGNFSYAVPSGYYALCTKNLATFG
jgi:hypothetical protein